MGGDKDVDLEKGWLPGREISEGSKERISLWGGTLGHMPLCMTSYCTIHTTTLYEDLPLQTNTK